MRRASIFPVDCSIFGVPLARAFAYKPLLALKDHFCAPGPVNPSPCRFFAHAAEAKRTDKEMPKRQDLKSILIIGAGPIVIGQACEFD